MRCLLYLRAVATGRAAADGDCVGSPRLADCAKRGSCHRHVGSDMTVLRLRLCDSRVFCLRGGFGDCANAGGHPSFGDGNGRSVFDGGLRDPDVVDQASGGDHFSGRFLWLGVLVQRLHVWTADRKLTANRDGHGLDLIRGAVPGGSRSVRSTEGLRQGLGVGGLDLVGLGSDHWVVGLVGSQDRSCDRLVSRVGRPAGRVDRVSRWFAGRGRRL